MTRLGFNGMRISFLGYFWYEVRFWGIFQIFKIWAVGMDAVIFISSAGVWTIQKKLSTAVTQKEDQKLVFKADCRLNQIHDFNINCSSNHQHFLAENILIQNFFLRIHHCIKCLVSEPPNETLLLAYWVFFSCILPSGDFFKNHLFENF